MSTSTDSLVKGRCETATRLRTGVQAPSPWRRSTPFFGQSQRSSAVCDTAVFISGGANLRADVAPGGVCIATFYSDAAAQSGCCCISFPLHTFICYGAVLQPQLLRIAEVQMR